MAKGSSNLALGTKFDQELQANNDFQEALDCLMNFARDLGFTQIVYGYLPRPAQTPGGDWLPLKLNVRNFPQGWESEWQRFMQIDPYYRACFEGTMPLEWTEIQRRATLSSQQRAACNYLNDFGLSRGLTVPVHLPRGRFAVVSAITDCSNCNWTNLRENARDPLLWLTHAFTRFVLERRLEDQIDTVDPIALTSREIECLRWAAAGKTDADTALIIGRSVETVRFHMKHAIRKLDANSRTQAVAAAVQMGLLTWS